MYVLENITGKQFKHLLKVRYAVSKDKFKPILWGIHFYTKNGKLYSEAVDGYRICKACIDYNSNQDINFIVRGVDLKRLYTHIKVKSNIKLSVDTQQGLLLVYIDNVVFNCQLLKSDFINTDKLISDLSRYDFINCTINKNILLNELKAIKNSINTNERILVSIVFHRTLDKITLVADFNDKEYTSTLDCKLSDMSEPISFNLKYLMDSVSSFDEKELNLLFTNFVSPLMIKNNNILSYLLPVRTDMSRREYLNNKVNTREAYYAALGKSI